MKLATTVRLTGALLAGVLLSLFSATTFAANTAAGTAINNIAIAGYSVGGVSQNSICSSPTGNSTNTGSTSTALAQCLGVGGTGGTFTAFLVDDKLLLTVTTVDATNIVVSPGQTLTVLTYKVTNSGNSTQGVYLTTAHDAGALATTAGAGFTGTDDFTPTAATVHVSASNTTTFNGVGTDSATSIPQLAAGAFNYVFITTTIPATQVDGDVAVEALIAQVATAGAVATYGTAPGAASVDQGSSAWTPGTAQTIFDDTVAGLDDAAYDGKASSRDAYIVKSAKLTISKSVVVLSDGTTDAVKHAIPGAVVQYTITVANSATATTPATSISLADALPSNTTWGTSGTGTMTVTTPGVVASPFACPDGSVTTKPGTLPYTAVSCDFAQTTAGTVTISGVYLKPGDTTSVVYTVTIN